MSQEEIRIVAKHTLTRAPRKNVPAPAPISCNKAIEKMVPEAPPPEPAPVLESPKTKEPKKKFEVWVNHKSGQEVLIISETENLVTLVHHKPILDGNQGESYVFACEKKRFFNTHLRKKS